MVLAPGLLLCAAACSKIAPSTTNAVPVSANSSVSPNVNLLTNALVNTPATNSGAVPVVATNTTTTHVVLPIAGFFDRVTKKHFGQYITPKTSPVQPERFTGYHAGADAETTPAEQSVDVPVYSIADGTVTYVNYVSGYGGVVMIQYEINSDTVTALYGHVRLSSVTVKKGNSVTTGQQIAVLGTGYSTESDGERKHLHFSLLKGASTNVKGYASQQSELAAWYDPEQWLRDHGAVEPKA